MFHCCVNEINYDMEYIAIISKVFSEKKVMDLEKLSDHF